MSFEVLKPVDDGIATITLAWSSPSHLFDEAFLEGFGPVLEDLLADEAVGALMFVAVGSSGTPGGSGDEAPVNASPPGARDLAEGSRRGQALLARLEGGGKPTLAAVSGAARGAACELALACHFRTVARGASFCLPAVREARMPGLGGTQRLPRLVGRALALEMLLTGEAVPAERAIAAGLVNRMLDEEDLVAGSRALLGRALRNDWRALRHVLEAVGEGAALPLEEGALLESALHGLLAAD